MWKSLNNAMPTSLNSTQIVLFISVKLIIFHFLTSNWSKNSQCYLARCVVCTLQPYWRKFYRCASLSCLLRAGKFYCFLSKNFFWKENFHFSSPRFFFFLKVPMTRSVQVCRVGVFYITRVGWHRGSDARGGGFESSYRP